MMYPPVTACGKESNSTLNTRINIRPNQKLTIEIPATLQRRISLSSHVFGRTAAIKPNAIPPIPASAIDTAAR